MSSPSPTFWNSTKKYISNSTKSMQDRSGVSYALAQADIFDRTKGYNIKKPKLATVSYNSLTELTQNNLNSSKERLPENKLSENNLTKSKNFTSNSNKKIINSSQEFNNEFKASTLKGRMLNTFEKTKLTTGLAKIKNNYTKSLEFINKITNLIKDSYNNKKLFQSSYIDLETKKKQLEQSASLDARVVKRYKDEINAIFTKLYDTSKAVIKSNKDIQDNINSLKKLGVDNQPNINEFLVLLDNNIIDYTRMYTRFFEGESKKNKGEPFDFTVKPFNPVLNASGNNSTTKSIFEYNDVNHNTELNTKQITGNASGRNASGNNSVKFTTGSISEYTGVNHNTEPNTKPNTKPIAGNASGRNASGNNSVKFTTEITGVNNNTGLIDNRNNSTTVTNAESITGNAAGTNPPVEPYYGGNKKTKTKSSVKKTKAKKDKKTKKVKKTKSTVKKTK